MSENTALTWFKFPGPVSGDAETWCTHHDEDGPFFTVGYVPSREAWRLHEFRDSHDKTPRSRWFTTLDDAQRAAEEIEHGD